MTKDIDRPGTLIVSNQQIKMSNEGSDHKISTIIQQKISGLSDIKSEEQCIFKVYGKLRSQNEEAYEPQVLSIGPYHRGKSNLKKLENHKLGYLQELLDRKKEKSLDEYINALKELKDRARKCYAEEIRLSGDEFVEMMCLDGCFIIQFLRKWIDVQLRVDDPIFQMSWLPYNILRDLILFENQIPFFILAELFDLAKVEGENLINLALQLCSPLMSFYGPTLNYKTISQDEVIHLLDLLHKGWCYSYSATLDPKEYDPCNCKNDSRLEYIKSITELQQSGIKFATEDNDKSKSWLHISFKDGKIMIPPMTVSHRTESVFRNLIAYEQYYMARQSHNHSHSHSHRRYVTDYAMFMDLLINSPMDVENLRHCQIFKIRLGDDEVVSNMFNRLIREISLNDQMFCYLEVFKEVNKYSSRRRNIWRAHLMRNYFSTPWAIISFLAAVILLFLTSVQTIFSIYPGGKND
ncbi:hypothetical protein ACH5RR_034474 [Cinchona calisaya]|uniref:Uncharacterized protein n=1 Tax=Cinchona calisaya TaxID=153742 RepID=A0ABD2YGG8_9GENT